MALRQTTLKQECLFNAATFNNIGRSCIMVVKFGGGGKRNNKRDTMHQRPINGQYERGGRDL